MKKEEIPGSIRDREEKILKLSDDIWEYAETKFEEYKSASRYCELLEAEGFHVTKGIADMETACQTRMLTFLDEGLVSPMGWHGKPFSAPLIIVAATNRPVREWIASGNPSFREDLFYRFDCVISLPPLRERRKDMRLLVSLSLQEEEVNPGYLEGDGIRRISLDAVDALERMNFPGNFRELRVRLKRACSAARREGVQILCLRHLLH